MKNKIAEAKLYANAAYLRNKSTTCRCFECQQKEAAERLAAVQRILKARFPFEIGKVVGIRRSKP